MPHSRLSFSDRAISALPFAASGQHIVRDEDVPGFFLLVGARSKTFMIQGDLWENGKRRTIRVKVGGGGQDRDEGDASQSEGASRVDSRRRGSATQAARASEPQREWT